MVDVLQNIFKEWFLGVFFQKKPWEPLQGGVSKLNVQIKRIISR